MNPHSPRFPETPVLPAAWKTPGGGELPAAARAYTPGEDEEERT